MAKIHSDTDTLTKAAFVIAIIGLCGLFFFVNASELKEEQINTINDDTLDTKVTGEVTKIVSNNKVSQIILKQACLIDVVIFDNLSLSGIRKGDIISVTGQSKKEEGSYKLYADKIELKN
ncbi:MAG: hypothetical protein WC755_02915 [Candidatus Woesearchaeota archaeon]